MSVGSKSLDNFLTQDQAIEYLKVYSSTIEILRQQIEPSDCGHLHTTIGVLENLSNECLNIIFK